MKNAGVICALRRWFRREPDPRLVAFDLLSAALLDEMRRNPAAAAELGRAVASFGVSAEEAGHAFGKMGGLTTRRESVV